MRTGRNLTVIRGGPDRTGTRRRSPAPGRGTRS
jgi:hypothetical protein